MDMLPLKILLVDDSVQDCYFFQQALNDIPILTALSTVDGIGLMDYFANNSDKPDVLFLDLNMPRKNGFECLAEIKLEKTLQHIPVVIYSSAFDEMVADELYKTGAHYYLQKHDFIGLKQNLHIILSMIKEKKEDRPPRNEFAFKLKNSLNINKKNPYGFY